MRPAKKSSPQQEHPSLRGPDAVNRGFGERGKCGVTVAAPEAAQLAVDGRFGGGGEELDRGRARRMHNFKQSHGLPGGGVSKSLPSRLALSP